jgi:hypothetical protein
LMEWVVGRLWLVRREAPPPPPARHRVPPSSRARAPRRRWTPQG